MHSWHLSSVRRIVLSRGHLALALLLVGITSCSNSSLTEPDGVPSTFAAAPVSGTFPTPSPVVQVADGSIRILSAWDAHIKNYGPNNGFDYGGRLMAAWIDR